MKWYTFNDSSSSTVNILLNHNTTALVAWNSSGTNEPKGEVQTEINKLVSEYSWKVTPRFITANEVAKITGADIKISWDSSNSSSDWYSIDGTGEDMKLDNVSDTIKSKYYWLYDYTNTCQDYGCMIEDDNKYMAENGGGTNTVGGYWTDTKVIDMDDFAWLIDYNNSLRQNNVIGAYVWGVRPVITISKTLIIK